MQILLSMYSFYYLAPTCFGTVAIFRELTPNCHYNIQHLTVNNRYLCYDVNSADFGKNYYMCKI